MDRLKTVVVIVGMLVVVVLVVQGLQRRKSREAALAASPHYTIGEVTRTSYVVGPNSHNVVFFTYRVGDSTYTGNDDGRALDVGARFLVKFSSEQPGYYRFYNQVPIPDSIPTAPPGGWLAPPFPVPNHVRE
jgi:hypothetical protein